MTAPALFSGQSFVALGWALFQFLWQGALVAGLFAALQRLLRNRTPALRYALACGALATMIGLPIATAWSLSARGGRHSSPATADFARRAKERDSGVTVDELVSMRIHGRD
jgi:hypothetical protein